MPRLTDSKTSKINKGRLGHDTLIEIKAGGIQMLPNRGLHWQCIRSLFKKKKNNPKKTRLLIFNLELRPMEDSGPSMQCPIFDPSGPEGCCAD